MNHLEDSLIKKEMRIVNTLYKVDIYLLLFMSCTILI